MSGEGVFSRRGFPVRCVELVKIYRRGRLEVQALRGVTLEFKPGSIVSVMGPSGSGKTTLLNLVAGVDRPTGGQVYHGDLRIDTLDDKRLDEHRLANVGYVFQEINLIPTLNALENVELPMTLAGVPAGERARRARALLRAVGLEGRASHYPDELSGGEQQRLAIAVALANDPPLILADEPTAELDYDNAMQVVGLLARLAREYGKTVVVTTHDPRVAVRADSIVRLEDGVVKGVYKPVELEEAIAPEAPTGPTRLHGIVDVIKARIARIEEEMREIEEKLARREVGLREALEKYEELTRVKKALEDLLASIGG